MICPECKSEYRDGFTVCADCDVPLVAQLPAPPRFTPADHPADTNESTAFDTQDPEDPFCAFWEGEDPRICADICSVLDEANIPRRVLRHEAHLFRITANSHIKIGVPFSLFEKAENAIGDAFGGAEEAHRLLRPSEPNRPQFAALVQKALKKRWLEEKRRSPFFSSDVAEGDSQEDEGSATEEVPSPERGEDGGLETSDVRSNEPLMQEVWRGAAIYTGDFIASCLKENGVRFSSAVGAEDMRIVVSEADEVRAREIVREVVEATPPSE